MQDQENIYKLGKFAWFVRIHQIFYHAEVNFSLGEAVPQFVNRKLSLYAEFSEFTRKQIKSFSETFNKWVNFHLNTKFIFKVR